MKNFTLAIVLFLALTGLRAQTVAPDFTATDCNGVMHHLYSELNSGKVIVLNFVMPCGSCIGPSLTAYNVSQSFASPNVLYYLIDDLANTSCTTLAGWADNYNIGPNRTTFSTSAIVESNYGGTGMPHVVVVGPNHTIYFNGLNGAAGNATAIQNAITSALSAAGVPEPVNNVFGLSANPSYPTQTISVQYTLPVSGKVTLSVYDETGKSVVLKEMGVQSKGLYRLDLETNKMAAGTYFVRLLCDEKMQVVKVNLNP